MSLDELKKDWDSLGESSHEHQFSDEQIKTILKSKYRSFIIKTLLIELPILLVYLYFIALTSLMFDQLEKTYLEVLGIIAITLLGLLFIMRFRKLTRLFSHRFLNHSHATVFKNLAKQKIATQRFFILNIILGFILLISLIIINIKIYNEYDLVQSQYFWVTILPSSLLFIVLINRWIRKYYTKAVREAERLLKELEE